MAKLTWPSIGNTSKGGVSEARTILTIWAEKARKSVEYKNAIIDTVAAFIASFGTAIVVKSGVEVIAPASTGSYVNGYTFTIANGVVTAVALS